MAAAGGAFKIAASKVAVDLHVTERGVNGVAAPRFAFGAAEHAALLAGDEDEDRARALDGRHGCLFSRA